MKYSSDLTCVKNMFHLSRCKILFRGSLFAYLLKFLTISSVKHNKGFIGRLQSLIVKSTFIFTVLEFVQTSNLTFHLKT